jgi:hypothetical protein
MKPNFRFPVLQAALFSWLKRPIRLFLAICMLISSGLIYTSRVSAATVVTYSTIKLTGLADYSPNPTPALGITMTVGGVPVRISDNITALESRFAMAGPVTVVITVNNGVTSAAIRPRAFGMTPIISGNTITFTLKEPRKFVVDINGVKDRLFIFADPLEVSPPVLGQANVKNVMDFAGVSNSGVVSTAAIQSAIDWVSANHTTKNILFFPDGVYAASTLYLKNYVQIYLASGAALLADSDKSHYSTICPDYADQIGISAFLVMDNVHDVKIFGRGVINGNGYHLYANGGFGTHRIETIFTEHGSYNLTLTDVLFTNSHFYQSHFIGSHDITLTNIKFHNAPGGDPTHVNDDGFKVSASYNVTYRDGWISARDDTITTAACCGPTLATQSVDNVLLDNIVLDGTGSASASVRFAFTDYGFTVHNVTMSNIYDVGIARKEVFLIQPWGSDYDYKVNWGAITLKNWTIESNTPIVYFNLDGNVSTVTVSNITLSNFKIDQTNNNIITGGPSRLFDNIHFVNLNIGGRFVSSLASASITTNQYATNVDVTLNSPAPTDLATSASASTTSLRAGDSAATGADGNFDTFFKSLANPTFPQYITLTWPSGQTFNGVTYVCDWCQGQGLKNWNVEVSTDGSTGWTTVASSGDVGWFYSDGTRETMQLNFPTVDNKKGVRLKVNNAYLSFGQYQVDEIQVIPSGVVFYQDINYGGAASVMLGKGDYPVLPASVPNDWMSSLRVPAGWIVDAYADGNFGGAVCTYTADTSWVGSACNDVMSSFKIH